MAVLGGAIICADEPHGGRFIEADPLVRGAQGEPQWGAVHPVFHDDLLALHGDEVGIADFLVTEESGDPEPHDEDECDHQGDPAPSPLLFRDVGSVRAGGIRRASCGRSDRRRTRFATRGCPSRLRNLLGILRGPRCPRARHAGPAGRGASRGRVEAAAFLPSGGGRTSQHRGFRQWAATSGTCRVILARHVVLDICEVHNIRDDDGDVIRSTAAQRHLDEAIGCGGRVVGVQDLPHRVDAHRIGEAVGAQHVAVARQHLKLREGWLHGPPGKSLEDQGPLRVGAGVRSVELALVNEGLDESIVLRDLRELPVAQPVGAGVTDVAHRCLTVAEQDRGEGAAHALQLWVLVHVGGDALVALIHRALQHGDQTAALIWLVQERGVQCPQGVHQEAAGHLAGRVATHAIGEGQQAWARVGGVLIIRAHQTAVGGCGEI